ncbi:hypothetical protein HNY73_006911 [Argiope bruennichi]|uniref:Uncharacterized protein n=1 Tax=Argiope bruennichi TaxID=94029 RepID=A0A8T0FDD0_ARGBR|nr:hypothetical protein HNY73_006911 [Argiope bruennichi]
MRKESAMCKTKMQTDELLDMIFSINQKQLKSRGNLRVEVLLKTTHELLDKELKEKQQSRKRKWEELKTGFTKKAKIDNDVEMVDEEILGLSDFYSNLKAVSFSSDENTCTNFILSVINHWADTELFHTEDRASKSPLIQMLLARHWEICERNGIEVQCFTDMGECRYSHLEQGKFAFQE